jgi:hypothetical protein
MFTRRFCDISPAPTAKSAGFALGIGLALCMLAAPPAAAAQLLIGGSSTTENSTRFSAPGLGNQYTADFPGTGLGEEAAQVRTIVGTLSKFRVRVRTATNPSAGSFTVTVRVNGADTQLTCTLNGPGDCSAGNKVKALTNSSLLSVSASNDFADAGSITYSYSMMFE